MKSKSKEKDRQEYWRSMKFLAAIFITWWLCQSILKHIKTLNHGIPILFRRQI